MEFSWVFVSFAGALVLIFFAMFAVKYIDLQETRENGEIARNMNNVLLSAKSSDQYLTYDPKIPKFSLAFDPADCEKFWINNDVSLRFNEAFFGSNAKSNNYTIWSKSWNHPFKIDTFVYVSSTDTKYYFSGLDRLEDRMAGHYEIVSNPSEADVLVFANVVGDIYEGKELIIDEASKEVTFVEDNVTYRYHSDEFIYGAIFSYNSDFYKCAYDKILNKFDNLFSIYESKAGALGGCDYTPVIDSLGSSTADDLGDLVENNNWLSNYECRVVF